MTVVQLKDTTSIKTDIENGQNVLRAEALAINYLADNLNIDFANVVELISNTKGKVIVTGMGKSGHIGAKLAATLAGSGTPAFFIHPGEASHGDLGMITGEDIVIALSNSGGTQELSDITSYCVRFNIPLVAVVSKVDSALGRAATIVLNTHVNREACPVNMAPTTSTTVTLALGDALAVSLMHRKGFIAEDFARLHPGGKLGSKMLKVSEIMATGNDVPLALYNTSMDKVLIEMTSKNLGGVGVTNSDGVLIGIITDGDLKRHMSTEVNIMTLLAIDVMSKNPVTIKGDSLAIAGVSAMGEGSNKTCLFVVDDENKPEGILHIHHCLQAGVI